MGKISPELLAAYQATQYRVTGHVPAFTLRIGQRSPELLAHYGDSAQQSAAFITAWNPRSEACFCDANEARQRHLIVELEENQISYFLGEGVSADGLWREPSLLALGIEFAKVKALAEKFEQNAFVYCDGNALPRLILLC